MQVRQVELELQVTHGLVQLVQVLPLAYEPSGHSQLLFIKTKGELHFEQEVAEVHSEHDEGQAMQEVFD